MSYKYISFGKMLIITFKRFNQQMQKDQSEKVVPIYLSMHRKKYSLRYTINHIGETIDAGHYTFFDV